MQAEAIVSQHWNDLKAIAAKRESSRSPKLLWECARIRQTSSQAHIEAKESSFETKLDKAQVRADAAASAIAICDSRRPIAISSKRRHEDDDDDDEHEMVSRENEVDEHQPAETKSKSSSSSSSSSFSSFSPIAVLSLIPTRVFFGAGPA